MNKDIPDITKVRTGDLFIVNSPVDGSVVLVNAMTILDVANNKIVYVNEADNSPETYYPFPEDQVKQYLGHFEQFIVDNYGFYREFLRKASADCGVVCAARAITLFADTKKNLGMREAIDIALDISAKRMSLFKSQLISIEADVANAYQGTHAFA